MALTMRGYLRKGPGQTRSRRPSNGPAALALIRQSDERRHGLAAWLSHSGMDRLATRAARMERAAGIFRLPDGRAYLDA